MTLNALSFQHKRPQKGDTLLLATHNAGKVREISELLIRYGLTVRSLAEAGLPSPDETGETCEANAKLKAYNAWKHTGLWSLADDSGLEVQALNGAPGVATADYGGWEHLLNALSHVPDHQRQARFVCVLALQAPDGETVLFQGHCEGVITQQARGEHGFGYDPVFQPHGDTRTFAEMTKEEKHAFSHRGKALQALLAWMENGE